MDPLTASIIAAQALNTGANLFNTFSGGGGMSDTQKNDQRFMNDFAWKAALRNEEYQRNYMQIRSMDAQRAGIHPLAALGVNVGSGPAAAAFVGSGEGSRRPNKAWQIASDLSDGLGQGLSRAMMAQKSADERALAAATLEKINSETRANNSMASMYDRQYTPATGTPPPMPTMDQNQKYQLLYSPVSKRYEWVLSPQASQAIMSDPVRMWSESLSNAFAGPETRPFWSAVGRSGRRLMLPAKKLDYRNWRD